MKSIKKGIQKELENLAPSFSKMEKKEHFDIPENYFSELQDQMLSQLDFPKSTPAEASTSSSWVDTLMEKIGTLFQPKVGIAFATAMLLLLSAYFITQNNTQQSIAPVIADLSIEEMENYIQENIDDFDEETLIEFAVQNDHNNFGEINANEEELENYMNEIIDEIDEEDLEELL